jgi:methyl acetate hydrolase
VREAARIAHVHHSTMTDRVEIITDTLGFDPMSGIGRTRLNLAFLRWRLRTSRVLELVPTRNA